MACLEQYLTACTQLCICLCRDCDPSYATASLDQHYSYRHLARTLPWTCLSHTLDPRLLCVSFLEPVSTYLSPKRFSLAYSCTRASGKGLIAGACIGILAAAVVVFVIVHFLIKLREWITETKLGRYGDLSTRNGRQIKSQTHETHVELNNVRTKESAV
jgi:hypothetical protein